MEAENGKYIFGVVKVGERGQIVIPKEAREQYDIKPGDSLMVLGDQKGIAMLKTEVFQSIINQAMEARQNEKALDGQSALGDGAPGAVLSCDLFLQQQRRVWRHWRFCRRPDEAIARYRDVYPLSLVYDAAFLGGGHLIALCLGSSGP